MQDPDLTLEAFISQTRLAYTSRSGVVDKTGKPLPPSLLQDMQNTAIQQLTQVPPSDGEEEHDEDKEGGCVAVCMRGCVRVHMGCCAVACGCGTSTHTHATTPCCREPDPTPAKPDGKQTPG